VGFAAEFGAGNAIAYGRDKLTRKRLDAVVVNDISRSDIGFDADANEGDDSHRARRAPRRARCQRPRWGVRARRSSASSGKGMEPVSSRVEQET
jgi:phosphopantothenoylcysteine decarboxylase/phosphopantothenate--cysteine ligase